MRVLIVAHSISNWTPCFARSFLAHGCEVRVVSFSPDPIEGVDVVFVGVEPFDKFRNKHLFFTRVPRVRRIIADWRPDIVFAPYLSSNGLCAALAWRGPLVVAAVGSDVFNHDGRRGIALRLREMTIKYTCQRSSLINTVSQGLTDELVRLGVPVSKILQMPFGTDMEVFRPAEGAPGATASRLICTRRHERLYDISTILNALSILRQAGRSFECVFTSGGTLLQEHQDLAARLGLTACVRFTGQLGDNELPGILRNADIYVSASLGDGTSVALLEAMATGLFPVVSRIGANVPWVQDGRTGLLFEPRSPQDLAQAMVRAMDDRELRRRAFSENLALVDQHANMKRHHERLLSEFERIVAERASR